MRMRSWYPGRGRSQGGNGTTSPDEVRPARSPTAIRLALVIALWPLWLATAPALGAVFLVLRRLEK